MPRLNSSRALSTMPKARVSIICRNELRAGTRAICKPLRTKVDELNLSGLHESGCWQRRNLLIYSSTLLRRRRTLAGCPLGGQHAKAAFQCLQVAGLVGVVGQGATDVGIDKKRDRDPLALGHRLAQPLQVERDHRQLWGVAQQVPQAGFEFG